LANEFGKESCKHTSLAPCKVTSLALDDFASMAPLLLRNTTCSRV
jgi:hypothetical protein